MKYLITGSNGQLGNEFVRKFTGSHQDFFAFPHDALDISDLNKVMAVFEEVRPSVVINTAAYNQVDLAEKDKDLAYKTNSEGIKNLLSAAEKYNAFLVHYSTDYVFDGKKENGLYTEQDEAHPLNEYGKSKYSGEIYIKESNYDNTLLFRTSWIFGNGKQNFIYKFLEWSKSNNTLNITSDEVSIPTSTITISDITLKALEAKLTGTYHLTNTGKCSRYELAEHITKYMKLDNNINPVSIESFDLPAKRPKFSAMGNVKLAKTLGIEISSWQMALDNYLESL